MKAKFFLILFSLLFFYANAQAQYSGSSLNWPTWKFDSLFYKSAANENTLMPYRLLKPLGYTAGDRTVKYPLVVMLHGKGEGMGSNWSNTVGINITQLAWGGKMELDSLSKYPAFYLHPQTFQGGWSSADGNGYYDPAGSRAVRILTELLDSLFRHHSIDMDRVYIHGLSGGGQGVWEMLFRNPNLFAATSPHSATGNLSLASTIVHNPLWTVQGETDTNPRPEHSVKMMDSLAKQGLFPIYTYDLLQNKQIWSNISQADGNPIYTFVPNVGHSAWPTLYNSPVWLKWMFSQNKLAIKVFGNGDRGICADGSDNRRIGISQGFEEYEWRKDGVLIPNSNTNDLIVSSAGSYSVRFKRKKYHFSGESVWSEWSAPVNMYNKSVSTTVPSIQVLGSTALPSLDGKTSVQLNVVGNYSKFQWSSGQTSPSITVSNAGIYKVSAAEEGKCFSGPSEGVIVSLNGSGTTSPTGLSAATLSEVSIRLSWTDNSEDETGFEIYRATVSNGPYTFVKLVSSNEVSFNDTGLNQNTTYYYKIRAINNEGGSSYTQEANAKTNKDVVPPTIPQNLVVTEKTILTATLAWDASSDNSGVKRYEIYGNGILLGTSTSLSYIAKNLVKDSIYIFKVKAVDQANLVSAFSNQVTVAMISSGLIYSYYEGSWSLLPDFSLLTPVKTGYVTNYSLSPRNINDNFAFQFDGYINITNSGSYTFYTASDDGSKLYIGNTQVVNNDGLHGITEKSGTISLAVGKHPIKVTFFEKGGGEFLEVKYASSGISKRLIPDNVLSTGNILIPIAPSSITELNATQAGSSAINLTWTDNVTNETSFEIYRALTSNGVYAMVYSAAANATSYTDINLLPNTQYSYKIKTVGKTGESVFSPVRSATTLPMPAPPLVPGNFTAVATSASEISVSWSDSNNEELYIIESSQGDNGNFSVLDTLAANVTSYSNAGLISNTTYRYRIIALNEGGTSDYSAVATAATMIDIPVAPDNLTANVKSAAQIVLSWIDNSHNEDGFHIERSSSPDSEFVLVGTSTSNSYSNIGTVDTTFYYRVRAYSVKDGNSDYSNVITVVIPKAPLAPNSGSWKLPAVEALDSEGNTELVNALLNKQDFLSAITVSPSSTKTITVKLPVMENDGMFIFNIQNNIENVIVRAFTSANSSNGADGTWVALPNPYVSGYNNDLQKLDIPQTLGGNWIRISFENTAVSNTILKELGMYQFSSTGRDNYILLLGASIEDALGGHAEFKNAIETAFPGKGYEPVIFNLAVAGSNTSQLSTEINTILARHPHASYVLVHQGGNNVSSRRPLNYHDLNSFFIKEQFADKYKEIAQAILNADKIPAIARISFRDYKDAPLSNGGLNQEAGSLPFNILMDDIIKEYNPDFYNFSERKGRIDLYQLTLNDQSILRASDGVHTAPGQGGKYIHYWVNSVLRYLYEGEEILPVPYNEFVPGLASKATGAVAFAEGTYKGSDVWKARILVEQMGDRAVRVPLLERLEAIDTNYVPSLPQSPSVPEAIAVSISQIDLSWSDNSDNEAGFEIYRSTALEGTYSLIYTAAANDTSYSDEGLPSNTSYFYKIRAVNKGVSDYSVIVSTQTFFDSGQNYPPVIDPIGNQAVDENDVLVLSLTSSDIDSDNITLSVIGLPSFASFTTHADGTGSITFSPGPDDGGVYQITLSADDHEGGTSSEAFTLTVADVIVSTETILYRVNAGAANVADINSVLDWSGDTQGSPSPYFDMAGKNQITSGTYFGANETNAPKEIFASYRYSSSTTHSIHYSFPVENGNYKIKLFFISKVSAINLRVFDVIIEGITQLDNYDIYADAGVVPVEKTFQLPVNDEMLDIELRREIGNQIISGIEIVKIGEGDPTPVNNTPILNPIANISLYENEIQSIHLISSDIDADAITLSVTGLPSFASFTDSTNGSGSLLIAPGEENSGVYTITVTAQDNNGGADNQTFTITVNKVPVGSAETILYRVNAGGAAITDPILNWEQDVQTAPTTYFDMTGKNQTSSGSYYGSNNTDAPSDIFASYRYTSSTTAPLHYSFPVVNGNYKVKLYFIARVSGAGLRVFDVNIEGITLIDNYDIYAETGSSTIPVAKIYEVAVNDGMLDIELVYEIGKQIISGIEIVGIGEGTGGPEPTVNTSPVINPISDQELTENETLSIHLVSSDIDADAITLSVMGLPSFVSFTDSTNGNGSLWVAPGAGNAGSYVLTITAQDGKGGLDSKSFTLLVNQLTEEGEEPAMPSETVIYRVNAGGAVLTDPVLNWEQDIQTGPVSYFDMTGKNQTSSGSYSGSNDTDAPSDIFASYRYTSSITAPLHYSFPVVNGNYKVKLYFIARVSGAGLRVFDVNIEGITLLDNYDIYAETGFSAAPVAKIFQVAVNDGMLDIDLGYEIGKQIISGIEIIALGGSSGARFASLFETSIATDNTDNIELYPVPVKDKMTVHFKDVQAEMVNVSIVDAYGSMIYENDHLLDSSGSVEIDMTGFNSVLGLYIVKLNYDDGKTKTFKIVKE